MTPVLERRHGDCPFWPVEPTDFSFAIPRTPTPALVGSAMWALVGPRVTSTDASLTADSASEAILALLTDEDDFAQGGLRGTSGDVVLDPGCCCGLDEWRDWLLVFADQQASFGHDPDMVAVPQGSSVRVWKDASDGFTGTYLDIQRDVIKDRLIGVQQDLAGFLTALHRWAQDVAPDLADPLVADIDRRLAINVPLDFTTARTAQHEPC